MENAQKTIAILKEIAKLENTIAKFYDKCSQNYSNTVNMWQELSKEEKNHFGYVQEIIAGVEKEPQKFEENHKFTLETVQTVISGVEDYIKQVENKELSERQALFIAKDIESSNLEKNFFEIVSTSDPEYKKLLKKLADETQKQRQFLNSKVIEYAPMLK